MDNSNNQFAQMLNDKEQKQSTEMHIDIDSDLVDKCNELSARLDDTFKRFDDFDQVWISRMEMLSNNADELNAKYSVLSSSTEQLNGLSDKMKIVFNNYFEANDKLDALIVKSNNLKTTLQEILKVNNNIRNVKLSDDCEMKLINNVSNKMQEVTKEYITKMQQETDAYCEDAVSEATSIFDTAKRYYVKLDKLKIWWLETGTGTVVKVVLYLALIMIIASIFCSLAISLIMGYYADKIVLSYPS